MLDDIYTWLWAVSNYEVLLSFYFSLSLFFFFLAKRELLSLHGSFSLSVCADITVKIITLPEEQLQEMETEEEGGGGGEGGEGGEGGVGGMGGSSGISGQDREENLANAMSLLLDSLLVYKNINTSS